MSTDTPKHRNLLRWWHQYQAQALNQEADLIRNGLLQDMFVLRRRLELSYQQPEARNCGFEGHLEDLKHIYSLLENLCNRLESPYLEDSLALALQHAVQPWSHHVPLQLDIPPHCETEPVEHTRLLVLLLENLWQQLETANCLPHDCGVALQCEMETKRLTLALHYQEPLAPAFLMQVAQSLLPFLETFQLLTDGDYEQNLLPQSLSWVFRWKPRPQLMTAVNSHH